MARSRGEASALALCRVEKFRGFRDSLEDLGIRVQGLGFRD